MPMPKPKIFYPANFVPQPNGALLVKPGAPVVFDDMIGVPEVAQLIGMSERWVQHALQEGAFKTGYRPGNGPRSRWRVSRAEVMQYIRRQKRKVWQE